MYLETICILSKKNSSVRSIDVSEYMGYSKPSVSRAVGILKKAAFLYKPYDTGKGDTILTTGLCRLFRKYFVATENLKFSVIDFGTPSRNRTSN